MTFKVSESSAAYIRGLTCSLVLALGHDPLYETISGATTGGTYRVLMTATPASDSCRVALVALQESHDDVRST